MNIIQSIQKSRKEEIKDEDILEEIKRQNPQKSFLFEEMEKEMSVTEILDSIIEKISPKEEETKEEEEKENNQSEEEIPLQSEYQKTKLSDRSQKEDEKMREQFLKRVKAKEAEEEA